MTHAADPSDNALNAPLLPAPGSGTQVEIVSADEVRVQRTNRSYRVRGLARCLSAESLRIALRVVMSERLFLDTVDLYQARARASFAKAASIELGVSESTIAADLSALVLTLEPLQDAALRKALPLSDNEPDVAPLSAADEAAGLALLRDKQLAERIVADVEAIGVVGERTNALIGYLACTSRLLDKPLAILIQSTSAAGKSTLMDALLSLMPERERVHYSAMTGQSLFYIGEGNLKHKILAIAEEEGVRQAAYALKLLQSQGELSIASTGKDPQTGKLITSEYRVEGPVMLCLTTTAIDIDEELLNRCVVLTINESSAQTAAIQQQQRNARTLAGLQRHVQHASVQSAHRAAQSLLRPLAVVNPFAEQLTFASDRVRLRRDHAKYLTLMDAVALLHQYQRKIHTLDVNGTLVEYIEVIESDIAITNQLAHAVLGRSLDDMPPHTRRVLAGLNAWIAQCASERSMPRHEIRFTRRDARAVLGVSDTQLRVHLERLVQLDYVLVHGGRHGQRMVYELLFDGDIECDAPQLSGLVMPLLNTTPHDDAQTSRGKHPTSRGESANFAGGVRGDSGPVAGGVRSAQTTRKPASRLTSSDCIDDVPKKALLRKSLNGASRKSAP